ncbi:MAG: hypothetical protein KF684_00660 [Phycisphaeraceae bacterium]|nr:hypothetical protein [Phycisphaeraceae bacterium]
MKIRSCVSVGSVLACASFVVAQGVHNNQHLRFTQEHGYTFSTIGDAGNAPVTFGSRTVGRVDYEYRVSTTEVTWGQYLGFLNAYAPVMPANFRSGIVGQDMTAASATTGGANSPITYLGPVGGVPRYTVDAARANQPAASTWQFFARMVNWLHHGAKGPSEVTSADFETGVYDTTTFVRIPVGPLGAPYWTDQDTRSPGSRFWIPSEDELTKATYYDPNRHGEGQGGYWLYGHGSDDAPVPGDPALGGETNAGRDGFQWPEGQLRPLDVGAYAQTQSPWGLLDSAGGGAEWTEGWNSEVQELQQRRLYFGGKSHMPTEWGELGMHLRSSGPTGTYVSLRLAAAIPAPGPTALILLGGLSVGVRRRR